MKRRANSSPALAGILLVASTTYAQGSMSLKPTGTTGQISGFVHDDTGRFVPGATVLLSRTLPIAGVAGARSFATSTDSHGFYQISNLPTASYKICPSAPGMQLLDPCLWSAKHPLIHLQGGQNASAWSL